MPVSIHITLVCKEYEDSVPLYSAMGWEFLIIDFILVEGINVFYDDRCPTTVL